jgi:hypothetical protein
MVDPGTDSAPYSQLQAVSCSAARACVAVGTAFVVTDTVDGTGCQAAIATRQTGSAWTTQVVNQPNASDCGLDFSWPRGRVVPVKAGVYGRRVRQRRHLQLPTCVPVQRFGLVKSVPQER